MIVPYLEDRRRGRGRIAACGHARCLPEAFRGEAASTFERLPFNHPVYILYSSGTTGVPKCIVHGAGGTLLQHLKEHRLQSDVRDGDRVFYFTTCGWMMWNWLVSGIGAGATLMLFDGSPFAPKPDVLFDYAQDEKITLFGTSAKYIDALQEGRASQPAKTHDLSSVRRDDLDRLAAGGRKLRLRL